MTEMPTAELLPCPFCGYNLDSEDSDTIYPSGIGWKDEQYGRKYVNYREKHDGLCHKVVCNTIYGGCGASIDEDSREEAIAAWNKRIK